MNHKARTFLGQAGKRLLTGAIATTLAAIAFAGMAQAGGGLSGTVGTTVTSNGSTFLWDYKVSNGGGSSTDIRDILIPELHAGDFLRNGEGFQGNQNGWSVVEITQVPKNLLPFNNEFSAGAFLDLTTNSSNLSIARGTARDFTFDSNFGGELASNVEIANGFLTFTVDPSSPDSTAATTVPEPGTLGLFGGALLGLVGWRRRRRG
jgi:hypothetical protein